MRVSSFIEINQKIYKCITEDIITEEVIIIDNQIQHIKDRHPEAYNKVLQELAVLKAKSEAAALYNAQMQISEQDFINGKIDIISLSLERGRRSTALVSYQSGRVALQNAITLLELLTNVKIMKR